MKKTIILFLVFLSQISFGQNVQSFIFNESEVYGVLNFMQTASGMQGTSSTYREFIDKNLSKDKNFQQFVNDFKKINFNERIKRQDYPKSRGYGKSYLNLIVPQAVKSKNLQEFNERITGIFPVNEQISLLNILQKSESYFKKYVWNDSNPKVKKQLQKLKKYDKICSEFFVKFSHFYQSSWSSEIPFYVSVYPIPVKSGTTTATPHGNALCVGILTDFDDTAGTISVSLHEMCHILYNEQSKEFQFELEKYFKENPSPYSKLAYSYFNEAMATVLGNGYAYKILNGKLDNSDWYNNSVINGFAKSIYPLTEKYLNENKSFDRNFINEIIEKFGKTFPNSIYEYEPNFNTINILTDKLSGNDIYDYFFEYFDANELGVSSPLENVSDSPTVKDSDSTLLFILDNNQQNFFEELKLAFPLLKTIDYNDKIQNISFIDEKQRMIVILFIGKKEDLKLVFEKLSKMKMFDKNKLIQY